MSVQSKKPKVSTELRALRLVREEKNISRDELGKSLGVTMKTIEGIENGRIPLGEDRKETILKILGIDKNELRRIKKHWVVSPKQRQRLVSNNSQRRSYRRIITKEVKILVYLRKKKNLTQDKASILCGYSRPSIGHIENGRIEITKDRIQHIVSSYGFKYSFFEELKNEELLREDILQECYRKMMELPESKLKLVQSVLANL